ncbi:MAG: OmpA family protein [Saccharospirillaceae bacterium]|nr:OmpA family protein [Pseudomonadales bacterium]NRB77494.1 OmpA family protein [Saccharospirillaceae bacterium]
MKFQQKFLAVAVSATLALVGCSTIDPYTGEKKVSKLTIGAAIGAIGGAVIGMAVGSKEDRAANALKGGAVGAIAGGAVGGYMDKQEKKMTEKLAGTGVSVTRNGDEIILNMPGEITFATGKSDLNVNFTNTLDGVILVLEEFEKTIITIEGHTDSSGSDALNQKLSEERALSVGQYLVNHNVVVARVSTIGRGETVAKYDNTTSEGRAQNRRVELTLTPVVAQ